MEAIDSSRDKTTRTLIKKSLLGGNKVDFEILAPEANEVKLFGSFDGWKSPGTMLKKTKGGVWKVKLSLSPGSYEYLYLVDNAWQPDRRIGVPTAPNPYGSVNSVVTVR
jgi:1,4-alpha-glucan branching enzyme